MIKGHMKRITLYLFIIIGFVFLASHDTTAEELLVNGHFTDGMVGWVDESHIMKSTEYPSFASQLIQVVDNNPYAQSLNLNGVAYANYYFNISQYIEVANPAENYVVSFDWKVTNKESNYGVCAIYIQFFNAQDERLGLIVVYDTAIGSDGNPRHPSDYFRGDLSEGQFYEAMKLQEVFDWEHVEVSTATLPDLDHSKISRIHVQLSIQNDASQGGEMFVDNVSVQEGAHTFPYLSVNFAGAGSGNITSDPAGINCTTDCGYSFSANTEVTLTANADPDSTFTSWSNCPSPSGHTCTVIMDAAKSITATFSSAVAPVEVTVLTPSDGDTFSHGDQVPIAWSTTNAQTDDTMGFSMKRDSATGLTAPDNENWYRFTSNSTNDGTETVTLPDSVLNADDWRFYVHHVSSAAYGPSPLISITESSDKKSLYLFKIGDGSGSITSNPAGIDCDKGCTEQLIRFTAGDTVVLTAEADRCSNFIDWEGCENTNGNQCTVTLAEARFVAAQFAADYDAAAELQVVFANFPFEQGRVVSTPPGIDCNDSGGKCKVSFCKSDTVTLTAYPADGATLREWSGRSFNERPCDSVSGNTCSVTLEEDWTLVHPEFSHPGPHMLHVSTYGMGSGLITSPSGINCNDSGTATDCDENIASGEEVTLTAQPDENSVFSYWAGWPGGDCFSSKNTTCTFSMSQPHTVEAVFKGKDLGTRLRANVDLLTATEGNLAPVTYYIDIANNNDSLSPSSMANVSIDFVSPIGSSGIEANWGCWEVSEGTCQKTSAHSFSVTVNSGETIILIGTRKYGSDVNAGTVRVNVTYPGDVDPDNDVSELVLHRDPADLLLDSRVLLKYNTGRSWDAEDRNTLVLTHGWQSDDPSECDGMKNEERLNCLSEHIWTGAEGNKGQAGHLVLKDLGRLDSQGIPNLISDRLNVAQYIWNGAFTKTGMRADGYIQARRGVFNAGKKLGEKLVNDLGQFYQGKVHFVGHSLGTAVNAYAIRHFLDNTYYAKVQMTILDHPNRVDRIGGVTNRLTFVGEKRWGFDKDFFASVLPELNDPENNRLIVDNYFAAGTFDDSGIATAGVGTEITGLNVYNHLVTDGFNGLYDPNDIGNLFFPEEATKKIGMWFDNDHTGVHQWYRWTIWPSRELYLTGDNFSCEGRQAKDGWNSVLLGVDLDQSLNPCASGFAFSFLQDLPLNWVKNGKKSSPSQAAAYDLIGGEAKGCLVAELGFKQYIATCATGVNNDSDDKTKASLQLPSLNTDSSYALMELNLSQSAASLSFSYKFENAAKDAEVFLLVDGIVVWSMNADSLSQGTWQNTGQIPVSIEKGGHKLMLAFNKATNFSSFSLKELQFIRDESASIFPWPLFLPALTGAR